MRCWVLAFALLGCGDVSLVPDAGPPDAYQPDSPAIPMCAAGETVCNGATCADTMSDELNCGGCNTQCAPTQSCEAGTCTPITTCKQVRGRDPQAIDGAYYTPSNTLFYCDFTNNVDYQALALGNHTATYPDYELMNAADLATPSVQQAFLAVFNAQGGLLNLEPGFTSSNCCMKVGDSGAGQVLALGGSIVFPAQVGANSFACGQFNESRFRFYLSGFSEYQAMPMSPSFFSTRAPSVIAGCADDNNPGLFVRKTPIN